MAVPALPSWSSLHRGSHSGFFKLPRASASHLWCTLAATTNGAVAERLNRHVLKMNWPSISFYIYIILYIYCHQHHSSVSIMSCVQKCAAPLDRTWICGRSAVRGVSNSPFTLSASLEDGQARHLPMWREWRSARIECEWRRSCLSEGIGGSVWHATMFALYFIFTMVSLTTSYSNLSIP